MSIYTQPPRGSQINKSHPLTRGLIGSWLFNEGTGGRVIDLSGNKIDGTLIDMDENIDWMPGKNGWALDFDGTNDNVVIGRPAILDTITFPFTISLWVKPTGSLVDHENFIFKGDATGGQMGMIMFSTGVWNAQFNGSADLVGGTLTLDTWFHVAYTADGTTAVSYQDGVVQNSGTRTVNAVKAEDFMIGGDATNGRWFEGLINDVRIYNRALSASEILSSFREPYAIFKRSMIQRIFVPPTGVVALPSNLNRIENIILRGVGRGIMRGAA